MDAKHSGFLSPAAVPPEVAFINVNRAYANKIMLESDRNFSIGVYPSYANALQAITEITLVIVANFRVDDPSAISFCAQARKISPLVALIVFSEEKQTGDGLSIINAFRPFAFVDATNGADGLLGRVDAAVSYRRAILDLKTMQQRMNSVTQALHKGPK